MVQGWFRRPKGKLVYVWQIEDPKTGRKLERAKVIGDATLMLCYPVSAGSTMWLTIIQKGIVLYGRRGHGPRPFSVSWRTPRPSTFYVQNTPICRVSDLPHAIPPERNRPDI
jgi:hypothetical protein